MLAAGGRGAVARTPRWRGTGRGAVSHDGGAVMSEFYEAASAASFALLGLWWVVVELGHETWSRDPAMSRLGYHISLYFLLPGLMSLVALIDAEGPALWRITFAVVSVLGAAQVGSLLLDPPAPLVRLVERARVTLLVTLMLYLAIFVVAIAARPMAERWEYVEPRGVEAILLAVLLLVGVHLAWWTFLAVKKDSY